MKNILIIRMVACLFLAGDCFAVSGQANLPYTLTFTSNDASNWSDGVAQDGDGGTQNITVLDIQIFAANASFNQLPGATMVWHNNAYFSSADGVYTAITPGPDVTVTNNGVPAMVMKSSSQANNFSLESIQLYDWGGNPTTTIAAYDNGTLKGSINVTFDDINFTTRTITQADALTPALFNNIDEVRFYPQGAPVFWLSFNNIRLNAPATVAPVRLTYFKASRQEDNSVLFLWETAQEQNSHHFEIQQSDNAQTFVTIAAVAARGNSALPYDYSFRCVPKESGDLFYRLKEVDMDGQSSISPVISVGPSSELPACSLYPNPARERVYINNGQGKIREIKVYAASGVLLKSLKGNGPTAMVDLSGLPQGLYYFMLTLDAGAVSRMIMKE